MNKSEEPSFKHISPLFLDVVMDTMFNSLPLRELRSCRLVCKTWCCNKVLNKRIREESVVNIRKIFVETSTTKTDIPECFKLTGPIYEIYDFDNISFNHTLVLTLFNVLGPSIKSIRLNLSLNQMKIDQFRILLYEHLPNLEELRIFKLSNEEVYMKSLAPREIYPEGMPNLPNLKRLELQEIRMPIVDFMTEFMSTLPHLREIILKTEVCSDWEDQAEMWRSNSAIATSVMNGLWKSKRFKSLKELRCGKLRTVHLQLLLKMGESGLQLEILELHSLPKDLEDMFTNFLETQKHSLQQLILFEQRSYIHGKRPGNPDSVFMLRLPDVMPKLEILQLSKYQKAVMVPMRLTDFSKQCPQLKKLILLGFDYGESTCGNLYIPEEPSKTVDELVLWAVCDDFQTDPRPPEMIALCFQNLTKLKVTHPTSNFVKRLWGHCEKLQKLSLELNETEYMDEAFTGIPETQIVRWTTKLENIRSFKLPDQKMTIMNLKDLRILEITVEFNDEDMRQALCDATAYFALGSMKQLRKLQLITSDWRLGLTRCQFFSKKCQIQLKEVLGKTIVYFEP